MSNIFDVSMSTAQRTIDEVFGSPAIVGADGKTYLVGHVTNVPEISVGMRNFEDGKALVRGIGLGLQHVGKDAVSFLATPGAAGNALLQIGPTLDHAVDYCAKTSVSAVNRDAQIALGNVWQALDSTLGHPLTPEQRGEHEGVAMAAFFPLGANKALTEKELQSLGGAQKLEQMTVSELEGMGIRKVADYPPVRVTQEELGLGRSFEEFTADKSIKDGIFRLHIHNMRQPPTAPTNFFRVIAQLKSAARAEGAVGLEIEGVPIDHRLPRVMQRFGSMRKLPLSKDAVTHAVRIEMTD